MNPQEEQLNAIEQIAKDATKAREARSVPVMLDILNFIVSLPDLAEYAGSNKTEDEKDAYWREKTTLFFPRLRERGLLTADIGYAFRLALAQIEGLKDIVEATVSEKEDYVIQKFLETDNINKISLDKLEEKELPYRTEDYEQYQKSLETGDKGADTQSN